MKKPATTRQPVADIIANRWSGRAYNPNKPVTDEELIALLEAARWAPSCYGDQPWRFVVCNKANHAQAWQAAFETLAESNQTWAKNAPLLILVCANTLFRHNSKLNRWAGYDTGAAVENMCLQATELRMVAHQMGGFSVEAARKAFNIPEQFELMAMVAIGHGDVPESLPDDLRERQLAPRQRLPLGELFFGGMWDTPIK
ncbi:MAG TPA: nitroreductase family protein [Methylophilus sp.]|nr:nitroreductase family protein [Methylophilus sp.]HQQ32850.1 nitroreductase family protein [Methylophilus sp.]